MPISHEDTVKIVQMLGEVFGRAGEPESLTRYSKTTSVVANVYVEDTVIGEDVAVPLLNAINQMYIGYVLTALQLENAMKNYKVIRSAVQRVATESFTDVCEAIAEDFDNVDVSIESSRVLEIEKNVQHLASGKVIEFDFIVSQDSKGKPVTVTVPFHVSMLPNSVTSAVADAFLSLNFTPTRGQRWKQVKAGEISLIRDFVLCRDLVDKYAKAKKEDTSNVLTEMLNTRNNSRMRHLKNVLKGDSANIASSVMVFDKRTFDRAASDANLDFSKFADRQKFFNASMSMIVAVVDTLFDQVEIYFNGLQQHSELTNRMVEKAGGSSGVDLKTFMAAIAKGNGPKF